MDQEQDTGHAKALSVSVVIAWVNPLKLLVPGLEALQRQRGSRPGEVIVVTRHDEGMRELLQDRYPTVTVLSAPASTPITALRSIGIRHARGDVIAVTEDHCIPCEDWIALIERGIGSDGFDVVGGPVENGATTRMRDWAAFLTEYAGAIRSTTGESAEAKLPGNNIAYKRTLIDGLCTALDRGLWESFYHEQLANSGVRMHFDPRMLVRHERPFNFWYFVRQRYHFCRSFAGMRCQYFTTVNRIKYGIGSSVLPPLLLLRGLLTLSRKGRLVGRYIACLPLIGVYVTVGAFGEMVGYFLGGRDSLVRVE